MESGAAAGPISWGDIGWFAGLGLGLIYLVRRKKRKTQDSYHENPQVQGIQRIPAHVSLLAFNSVSDARKYVSQPRCSPFVKFLNGTWNFKLYDNVDEALATVGKADFQKGADFTSTDASSGQSCANVDHNNVYCSSASNSVSPAAKLDAQRDSIQVPGHWQLQCPGDSPIYTNFKYIIPVDPPRIPKRNPTGYYRRNFSVSNTWKFRKVILFFGGVDSAFYVFCNNKFVGFSKDSRLPAEFDISNIVSIGNHVNTLEVVVPRFSDGFYLEDQDMFNLSGIFRDVYLYSVPNEIFIQDFSWKTSLDSSSQIGSVNVDVVLKWDLESLRRLMGCSNYSEISSAKQSSYLAQMKTDWIVSCSLFEEGILVSSSETRTYHNFVFDNASLPALTESSDYVPLLSNDDGFASLQVALNINSPPEWCPEKPYLYTLVVSLISTRDNIVVQAESCRLGFRTIDISNGLMRVNQRPVMIRGTNLHEHDPVSGHTVSPALIEADIKLMKRNNFNAIRTSHYPASPWFYELCSIYGMFVVDEANIETHGMRPYIGYLADQHTWEEAFMLRLKRMYERDKVHPCIITWSLGNESGYGAVHDAMATWIRRKDPSRLLMYEPASYGPRVEASENSDIKVIMATDILCPMYSRIEDCIKLANIFPDIPVVLCEYSHMMGNSGGNLSDYWAAFRQLLRLQGGFIWDWVDQGISVVDSKGTHKWAYGGDFGEVSHDSNFCLNGLNWPDRGLGWALRQCQGKNDSKVLQKRAMALERPVYGLAGRTISEQSRQHALLAAMTSQVDTGVDVDSALLKPVLLEAKQCMRCFECSFVGIKQLSTATAPIMRRNGHGGEYSHDYNDESNRDKDEFDDDGPNFIEYHKPLRETKVPFSVSPAFHGEPISDLSRLSSPNLNLLGSDGTKHFKCAIRLSIINNYDHIDDIQNELEFYSILLCDGIMVASSKLHTMASSLLHKNNSVIGEGTGRHSIQEVESEARFSLNLLPTTSQVTFPPSSYCGSSLECAKYLSKSKSPSASLGSEEASASANVPHLPTASPFNINSNDKSYYLVGITWPEQTMLDAYTLDDKVQDLANIASKSGIASLLAGHKSTDEISWTDVCVKPGIKPGSFDSSNRWSIVVIGRLAYHTVWAPRSYPMGFVQSDISKQIIFSLAEVLCEAPVSDDSLKPAFKSASPPSSPVSNFKNNRSSPAKGSIMSAKKEKSELSETKDVTFVVMEDIESVDSSEVVFEYQRDDIGDNNSMDGDNTLRSEDDITPSASDEKSEINDDTTRSPETDTHTGGITIPKAEDNSVSFNWLPIMSSVDSETKNICRYNISMKKEIVNESSNSNFEVIIDGSSGLPEAIIANGVNLLVERSEIQPPLKPARIHMHRAITDNDRIGYLPIWEAVGLDSEFGYKKRDDTVAEGGAFTEMFSTHGKKINEDLNIDLDYISVQRISRPNGYEGISCSMQLIPQKFNKSKVRIIKLFNSFMEDPSQVSCNIPVYNYEEELFTHSLAGSLLLARESHIVNRKSNSQSKKINNKFSGTNIDGKTIGSSSSHGISSPDKSLRTAGIEANNISSTTTLEGTPSNISSPSSSRSTSPSASPSHTNNNHTSNGNNSTRSKAVEVTVVRPKLWMISTIPRAESVYGPMVFSPDNRNTELMNAIGLPPVDDSDPDCGSVIWTIDYLFGPQGDFCIKCKVDACSLITCVPRLGIQLLLDERTATDATWFGCGPHECYPDRKASAIQAVHSSPIKGLYTPYIMPSENGNRTSISWLTLNRRSSAESLGCDTNATETNVDSPVFKTSNSRIQLKNEDATFHVDRDGSPSGNRNNKCEGDFTNGGDFVAVNNDISPTSSGNYDSSNVVEKDNNEYVIGQSIDPLSPEIIMKTPTKSQSPPHVHNLVLESSVHDPERNESAPSNIAFRIASSRPFNFSAQPYTTEDLHFATHNTDLEYFPRSFSCLNLDAYLMGLGGDDSWSASVHEDYLIQPDIYSFDWKLSFSS